MKCDKCGKLIRGGPKELRKHKRKPTLTDFLGGHKLARSLRRPVTIQTLELAVNFPEVQ